MVGNLRDSNNDQAVPLERIIADHNINQDTIRDLIQGSLEPLPLDPIPSNIIIKNIVITRNREGRLNITCEVLFNRDPVVAPGPN